MVRWCRALARRHAFVIARFLALDGGRRRLALEAAGSLMRAWFRVRCGPFRGYAGAPVEQRTGPGRDHADDAAGVSWAIAAVSARLPWTSTCLMQAIAGQSMLRRRGIPATVRLGLARDEGTGRLLAHAWLVSGDAVLAGGDPDRRYALFGDFTGRR